jgi:membrane-associated PAP2 superfamily phosphatase
MRGAHFMTHTLWSMWVAGLIIAILARLLYCSVGGQEIGHGRMHVTKARAD